MGIVTEPKPLRPKPLIWIGSTNMDLIVDRLKRAADIAREQKLVKSEHKS